MEEADSFVYFPVDLFCSIEVRKSDEKQKEDPFGDGDPLTSTKEDTQDNEKLIENCKLITDVNKRLKQELFGQSSRKEDGNSTDGVQVADTLGFHAQIFRTGGSTTSEESKDGSDESKESKDGSDESKESKDGSDESKESKDGSDESKDGSDESKESKDGSDEPNDEFSSSRFLNDYEQLGRLGRGASGSVVHCQHKLDGREYAVKVILLKDERPKTKVRILREVKALSRLQHQHIVRYYQAWFETRVGDGIKDKSSDSEELSDVGHGNKAESTYLYIQMEYCSMSLGKLIGPGSHFDEESAWSLSRQLLEGISHIHEKGIIHCDLTRNNIFFDGRMIKIGDFGLAKFQDEDDSSGSSDDCNDVVVTDFYMAPEMSQRSRKINEKADMYSFGVLLFEIWQRFGTECERSLVLKNLKESNELPSTWVTDFAKQAALVRKLISSIPEERPSANEILVKMHATKEQLIEEAATVFHRHSAVSVEVLRMSNELRPSFARWIVANKTSSFKNYQISHVYRELTDRSRYLQGNYDVVGGETISTDAEVIKVSMDILSRVIRGPFDIHINHAQLLKEIWSRSGIKSEQRHKVAKLLCLLSSFRPQSSERIAKWNDISRQLSQELHLAREVVRELGIVESRLCGSTSQILPRLMDKFQESALSIDHMRKVVRLLEEYKDNFFVDPFMLPTENYHRNLYFQVYERKESTPGRLLAIGGRYDHLIHQMADSDSDSPGAVGTSIALETILRSM